MYNIYILHHRKSELHRHHFSKKTLFLKVWLKFSLLLSIFNDGNSKAILAAHLNYKAKMLPKYLSLQTTPHPTHQQFVKNLVLPLLFWRGRFKISSFWWGHLSKIFELYKSVLLNHMNHVSPKVNAPMPNVKVLQFLAFFPLDLFVTSQLS